MIVADSSVWIDFFIGAASAERAMLRKILREDPLQLVVPDLVVFEVLRGFREDRQQRLASQAFAALDQQAVGGAEEARRAAERYRRLRAAGITVRSSIDVLVASYCIDRDLILLQRDRDFLPFAEHFGLRLLQPLH